MPDLNTRARDALRRLHEAGRIRDPWLAGMAWHVPPTGAPDDGGDWGRNVWGPPSPGALPDTSDGLTVMGLLLLLREATGDPGTHAVPNDGCRWWWIYTHQGYGPLGNGATEAEAVVDALERLAGRMP